MENRRTVKNLVYYSGGEESYKFTKSELLELANKVPENTGYVVFNPYICSWGDAKLSYDIVNETLETDEQIAARIANEKAIKEEFEKSQYMTYLKLKAKFENHEHEHIESKN